MKWGWRGTYSYNHSPLSNVIYGATNDGEEMARHFLALGNFEWISQYRAATAEIV